MRSCGSATDVAAIAAALASMAHDRLSGRTDVMIAARDGIPYQVLVTVMEAAIRSGFVDVDLDASASLPIVFPTRPTAAEIAEGRCSEAPRERRDVQRPPCVAADHFAGTSDAELRDAPVMVVSGSEVSVSGKRVSSVDELRRGDVGARHALETALRALPLRPAFLILQADPATDTAIINRIVSASERLDRAVLFAVKNK